MLPAGAIGSCATEHLVLPLTRTPPFSRRRRNGVYRLRNLRDASVSLRFSRLLSRRAEKRIGARITIDKSHETYSQWNTKETSRVRVLFSKIYFYSSAESLPISTQNDQRCSSAFMTSRKGLSSGPIKWRAPFLPLHPITYLSIEECFFSRGSASWIRGSVQRIAWTGNKRRFFFRERLGLQIQFVP